MSSIASAREGPAAPTPGALELELDRRGDEVVVLARGEIDLGTSPELRLVLASAARGSVAVRVDLSRVTFMDSSGIHVLDDAQRSADDEGHTFAVKPVSASVARVMLAARACQGRAA